MIETGDGSPDKTTRESSPERNAEFTAGLFQPTQAAWSAIAPEIIEIERLCFGGKGWSAQRLEKEFLSRSSTVVILRNTEKTPIGFSLAQPDMYNGKSAYIWTTDIHPRYQGQNLVGKIMDTMEDSLRKLGFLYVTRNAAVPNGYADKIERHYKDRIVQKRDEISEEFGPQRFFKIKL